MAAERALASFDHRHRFVGNVTYALPDVGRVAAGVRGLGDRLAGQRHRHAAVGRAVHREPRHRSRQHRLGPGAAARRHVRSERRRCAHGAAVVQHRRASRCRRRSPSATPAATPCSRPATRTSTSRCRRTVALGGRPRLRAPVGGLQPASTARTSTCRTASRSRRTSAASSARAPARQMQFGVKVVF